MKKSCLVKENKYTRTFFSPPVPEVFEFLVEGREDGGGAGSGDDDLHLVRLPVMVGVITGTH